MADIFLTKDGFKALEEELRVLTKVTLPDIKQRMSNARQDGDLSENNAWITSKEEMEIAHLRISELKQMLKTAKLVEETKKETPTVVLGDSVTVKMNGNKLTVKVVPTMEADPTNQKLSEESPLGKALLGKKIGEVVTFRTPAGEQTAEIVAKG